MRSLQKYSVALMLKRTGEVAMVWCSCVCMMTSAALFWLVSTSTGSMVGPASCHCAVSSRGTYITDPPTVSTEVVPWPVRKSRHQ